MQTGKQHVQCKIFVTAIKQIKNESYILWSCLVSFNSFFTLTVLPQLLKCLTMEKEMARVISMLLIKIQMTETIKYITLELRRNVSPKFSLHALIHCSGVWIPSVAVFLGQYHFSWL